jgi:hypothetical protein
VLEHGEEHLYGVEVWGVLGREEEPGADGSDSSADRLCPVRSQIVYDDDVVSREGWGEDLFHVEQEALAIDRSLAGARRLEAAIPVWRKAQAKLHRQLAPDLARRLAAAAETLI